MEGMPRVPMLIPDLKYPTSPAFPEFCSRIKEYILTHYEDDPKKFEAALNEMESLRSKFCSFFPDVEAVCQVKRYYAQLRMMKSRFPMEEGDPIRIPFSWSERGSDSITVVYDDVNFELACVMFNIGAIHAAIAASEARSEPDSIKNAFTHFQCAAYPFQYIRDKMGASKFSVVDFDTSILTFYVNILLAQAQECILEKSLLDHRKNTIVAKIATYLKDVYRQCGDTLVNSCASDVMSSSRYKEWLRTCDVKSELYGAVAMLHMGDQAGADQKMGARLVYYEMAQKHIQLASKYAEKEKRESLRQAVNFVHDIIDVKCTGAKKDNDFVYHDRIPKVEELPTVEPVTMVKPIAFDPTERSVSGDDLFSALLPMNVIRAVSVYSEEKAKYRRDAFEKVAAKDQELEAYLLSLHLDEINLDSSVDEMRLPDSLLEKSAAFNSQPDAFPELLEKLKKVGDCAVEAESKLGALNSRLGVIDLPELTSDDGFLAISKELLRITEDHKKARENNTKLQKAIAMHSENLRILAMPLTELNRRISGPVIKPSETAEGAHLKKMLDKANEMKRQREQLCRELTKDLDNDDITAKCLAEKDFDNEDLFKKELAKHDKTTKLIEMNLTAQTNILNALTDANASFAACRKQVMELNSSRKDHILALSAAYEVYCNVLQKANEGLKFYSTLFVMVRTLGEAIEGIEEAYAAKKAEKDKAKYESEERSRKLKLAREARETMRQFSSESSEVSAITSGALNSRSGMSGYLPFRNGSHLDPSLAAMSYQQPAAQSPIAHFQQPVAPSPSAQFQQSIPQVPSTQFQQPASQVPTTQFQQPASQTPWQQTQPVMPRSFQMSSAIASQPYNPPQQGPTGYSRFPYSQPQQSSTPSPSAQFQQSPTPSLSAHFQEPITQKSQNTQFQQPAAQVPSTHFQQPVSHIPNAQFQQSVSHTPTTQFHQPASHIPATQFQQPMPQIPSAQFQQPASQLPSSQLHQPVPQAPWQQPQSVMPQRFSVSSTVANQQFSSPQQAAAAFTSFSYSQPQQPATQSPSPHFRQPVNQVSSTQFQQPASQIPSSQFQQPASRTPWQQTQPIMPQRFPTSPAVGSQTYNQPPLQSGVYNSFAGTPFGAQQPAAMMHGQAPIMDLMNAPMTLNLPEPLTPQRSATTNVP